MKLKFGQPIYTLRLQKLAAKIESRKVVLGVSRGPRKLDESAWILITKNDKAVNWTNDKRRYYRTEYLRSEHWRELRARKLKASPACECCGSVKRVEPHHIRYRNLFDVELSDLMTMCRKCHKAEHRRLDAEKRAARNFNPSFAMA